MKPNILLIFLIGFVFLTIENFAQTSELTKDASRSALTQGEVLTFSGVVKTTDSLVSKNFELSKYDNDAWTTKPSLGSVLTTDSSVIKLMFILHGSWNGTDYVVLDTLLSVDQSVNLYKTKGLATISSVPPWYRLIIKGLTGNKLSFFNLGFYLYKSD